MKNATAARCPTCGQKKRSVHFSSENDEWGTPQDLFDQLDAIHHFEVDVCARGWNTKCAAYFAAEADGAQAAIDGLAQRWAPRRCWMNPPYGRGIAAWMAKARAEAQDGALVVCLVPARTDTRWWHEYASKGEVTLLKGRLTFDGAPNGAPFPSAIVVFRPPAQEVANGDT